MGEGQAEDAFRGGPPGGIADICRNQNPLPVAHDIPGHRIGRNLCFAHLLQKRRGASLITALCFDKLHQPEKKRRHIVPLNRSGILSLYQRPVVVLEAEDKLLILNVPSGCQEDGFFFGSVALFQQICGVRRPNRAVDPDTSLKGSALSVSLRR